MSSLYIVAKLFISILPLHLLANLYFTSPFSCASFSLLSVNFLSDSSVAHFLSFTHIDIHISHSFSLVLSSCLITTLSFFLFFLSCASVLFLLPSSIISFYGSFISIVTTVIFSLSIMNRWSPMYALLCSNH